MTTETKEKTKKMPEFRVGDSIRVFVKVVEGDSERIQAFEGVVLLRRGRGISENFTVRKVSFGVGVERTFPIQSPLIDKIEVTRSGRARRARLYYLRNLKGKAAKLNEVERPSADSTKSAATPSSHTPKGNGTADNAHARVTAPQVIGTAQ